MPWHVYILRCANGALYIGHTIDLQGRERYHNLGQGAHFTSQRRPVKLVYHETFEVKQGAISREKQLKRWSREKKEALIRGNFDTLKSASKRRP